MPAEGAKPRQVLIVDDGVSAFAAGFGAHLRGFGYQIMTVAPAAVFEALQVFDADAILCDIEGGNAAQGNLLGELLTQRPDVLCIPMAARPNRRRITARQASDFHFIDKSAPFDASVAIIDHAFAERERAAATSGADVLREAQEAVAEAKRAKFEFLAKISHELRTPLNAIIGFSELIMRDMPKDPGREEYRSYIDDIHASGRHLLNVINDILDFAKADAGKLVLLESEVDVHRVLDGLKRLIGPRARDVGLDLEDRIPAEFPHLWCDERKLKQMLLNLLTNAVKFTPAGGKIAIEGRHDETGLAITISDSGIGMARDDLPRVLQPFVQAENTLGRRREGTGLGLALVKAMMEIHGGSIEIQSELGAGTAATLKFPPARVMTTPPVEDPVPRRTPRPRANRARI